MSSISPQSVRNIVSGKNKPDEDTFAVAEGNTLKRFNDVVNKMLKEGWKLHGTPFIIYEARDGLRICQPMTKV